MADYERTTRAVGLDALPGDLREAVAARTVATDLFLTHSVRTRRPGLFSRIMGSGDKDAEHWTVLAIGTKDLHVGTYGAVRGTAMLTCRLDAATATEIEARTDDSGLSIRGFPTTVDGHATVGSFFFGTGPPGDGDVRQALQDAISAARR